MTNAVQSLLVDLAACLCVQIEKDGSPPTCFCGVIPGDAAVADYGSNCKGRNGMAWTRLADLYPASGVSIQSTALGTCGSTLGFTIEIGILRQMKAPSKTGAPPSANELLATSNLVTTDAITMRRAIACCSSLANQSYMLGSWAPGGPLGLMVGGVWTLSVAL